MIKTVCDSVNHTRFPKEDHLPYWSSGQQSYEGWSCRVPTEQNRLRCWDVVDITMKHLFEKLASFLYRLNDYWLLRKGQLHAAECSDIDQWRLLVTCPEKVVVLVDFTFGLFVPMWRPSPYNEGRL